MHILLSAYACKPNSGSEEGNGWGWATHLAARGLRVHVLTVVKHQVAIELEQKGNSNLNLSFSFLEPTAKGLKGGHGLHYLAWQFSAVDVARRLHSIDPFDLVHHVTYGSIHVPTQLWRLGLPVVFGPVGGGQTSPFSMRSYFGDSKRKELFRTAFTKALRFSPFHRRWLKRMAVVFAGNKETLTLVQQLGMRNAILAMDVGIPLSFLADCPKVFQERAGPIRFLWTGRMMPRKALSLTLDAFARTRSNVSLTIVGGGYQQDVVWEMIKNRQLIDKVTWSGMEVSWSDVRDIYKDHDAFVFTSLRDSCGSQLLEAMAVGLPVITLDLHGGALLTPDEAGYKIPVTTPDDTAAAVARAIDAFAMSSTKEKNAMSIAGWKAAHSFTFDVRAQRAELLYRALVFAGQSKDCSKTSVGSRSTPSAIVI